MVPFSYSLIRNTRQLISAIQEKNNDQIKTSLFFIGLTLLIGVFVYFFFEKISH